MTASTSDLVPPVRRLRMRSLLAYGFGSVAYGVKDNGFQTFLLIFYNQMMGLPAVSVGLAIMLALFLDAMVDPLIGALSDRTRSGWGRRHPWMYASAVPIAVGWLLLWNPPALSQFGLLAWVFATAVVVRTAVSAYEVPSAALTAELSADYDERTRIVAYRYVFGWAGGLTMLMAAYTLFLVPTVGQPNGLMNRHGYQTYAIAGAILMFIAIIVSAAGTHHEIGRLPKAAAIRTSNGQALRQVLETVRNRPFAMLLAAGLCGYTSQGVTFALSNYFYSYVWNFPPSAFLWLGAVLFAGVLIAFVVAPRAARRFEKRKAAAICIALSPVLTTAPYLLRLAGLFPAPGDAMLLPLLFATLTGAVACGVSAFIIGASMMADVVEHSEVRTGRRSEGLFSAGNFLVQKSTAGLGIFVAGALLSIAGFPNDAQVGQVPKETIDRLTLIFSIATLAISWAAALCYARFPFGREEHHARVGQLAGTPSSLF